MALKGIVWGGDNGSHPHYWVTDPSFLRERIMTGPHNIEGQRGEAIYQSIMEIRDKLDRLELNTRSYVTELEKEITRLRWIVEGKVGDEDMERLQEEADVQAK